MRGLKARAVHSLGIKSFELPKTMPSPVSGLSRSAFQLSNTRQFLPNPGIVTPKLMISKWGSGALWRVQQLMDYERPRYYPVSDILRDLGVLLHTRRNVLMHPQFFLWLSNHSHFLKNEGRIVIHQLISAGLKGLDVGVVWAAAQAADALIGLRSFGITAESFTWVDVRRSELLPAMLASRTGNWDAWGEFHRDVLQIQCRSSQRRFATLIPLSTLQPVHAPIYDYFGRPPEMMARVEQKLSRLQELVLQGGGVPDSDLILTQFLRECTETDNQVPAAIQLQSGIRIVIDGHHRLDLLRLAAERDIIPVAWLDTVPVRLYNVGSHLPEALVLRIMAHGYRIIQD